MYKRRRRVDPKLRQQDHRRGVRRCPKGFPADLFNAAIRKLALLDAAVALDVLARPPGNRLEALRGDRAGQHSIQINDQFRICFRWTQAGPADVEITDYH